MAKKELAQETAGASPRPTTAEDDGRAQIVYLPVKSIYPHPQNPRKDLGDLTDLVGSIKAKGILQNLTVVPRVIADVTITDEWVAVIGHRRHAAAIQAGLTEVPCVISDMAPKEQFETMMIENVQRNALTAYEQAKGFQMMLDMGDSVEEVARKTGFSESTIRRRAQLAQLDEDKFKKTEKRGASLEDYLKLSKIQDPSKRNKVLESIGTREFANELKKAVDQEKYQKFFAQLKETLKKADWVEQVDLVDYDRYQWKATYNSSNQQIPSPVEGAEPGEYVYTINGDRISLYHRKGKKPKKSEEEKLLSRLQKDIGEVKQELEQIRKRFFEIRFEFVKSFTAFSTYEMDIAAFAANAIVENQNGRADAELVAKLLSISTYRPTGQYYDCVKKEEWGSVLFRRPQEALLYAAYAKLDGKNQGYYETKYEYKLCISMPSRSKNERLNLLYKGLVSLGYEMSEEEVQLQNGTHPLFDRAKAFKKTYDQDLAKLKNKRKDQNCCG